MNKEKNSFDVESPDAWLSDGASCKEEVTVFQLAHLGPASDLELCAWWDSAVVRPPALRYP